MSNFEPTASQRQAIEARGSAVLVSAGAGSGKTRVLTERLISRLTDANDPCDIDKFVIITFTRAAAAELRGRIMAAIAEALAKEPGNRHLRRQNALCRQAQIGTIHSFCASVLRENAHAAGIAPDFRVIEDERAAAMKKNAIERVLEARYANADKFAGFTDLADTVGAGRDDSRLEKLVLELYDKMQCHSRPEAWAEEQTALISAEYADVGETPWGREILADLAERTDYWRRDIERLIAAMPEDDKLKKAYLPALEITGEGLGELSRSFKLGWERAREAANFSVGKLVGVRNTAYGEYTELVKARLKACRAALEKIRAALAVSSDTLLADMKLTSGAMAALLELTLDFGRAFRADKRRLGLMDFADLEHETVRLLTDESGEPTELARQLSARYREIMVDEYQDVSRVQDDIFAAISDGGRKLFLVGDIKQAIYRFRLADPEIFNGKYRAYKDADTAADGEARRILLRENFRSREEIINCANSIFSSCMSRELGDVDYDGAARLVRGAKYGGSVPLPEVVLLDLNGNTDDPDGEPPSKLEQEAAFVAERIRALVDAGTPVSDGSGGTRPIEYGDIAILLRAPTGAAPTYSRVLARFGVPTAAGGAGGYFSSVEVSAVMSMLAVIDNPHQDIPLIAVLRSPAFAMTGDELSAIRAAAKGEDFYTALVRSAEESEKCRAFLDKLAALRAVSAEIPAAELVWRILEDLELPALCGAMNDGEKRRARLFELVELAEKFEGTGARGLHRFVLWLRAQAAKGIEPAVGVSGSAVHIMSMHKSKGLEFPVVFLADMAHRFNMSDSTDTVPVHPELGLGPKVTDRINRAEYPSLARVAIAMRQGREMRSEEMRLFYVAVTRARERLFIVGAVKNADKYIEKLRCAITFPIQPQALMASNNMLDWAVSAAIADDGETMNLVTALPGDGTAASGIGETASEPKRELSAELARRLAFAYPYPGAEDQPSKVTATEKKGHAESDEDARSVYFSSGIYFDVPDFKRRHRPLTGAQKGNAAHTVLQYMDFAMSGTADGIRSEIERLRSIGTLSDREAEAVDAAAIEKLFASELGRRMLSADMIKREFKFSLMCDASSVPGCAGDDKVLLQGVVDCCIAERGELVVIDYKTDRVRTDAEISERAAYYAGQIRAYAGAMERIFKMPVKECVLYFISAGKAVTVK